jgi:signal transduction histidine kinase
VAAETYGRRADDLHTRMESAKEPGASLAEYNGFLEQSRRFMDLGEQLARAHYESRNPMLAQAGQTLTYFRVAVLVLVALLFVFGGALGLGVYRSLIAPLQVKLVASQALAERNEKLASLGLLAAGVAHEVRTPLTAIKTALYIQQKKLQPGSPEQGEARVIEKEISRLEHIVSEFLHFARPAQPRSATVLAEASLQEVESLLGPQLVASDIRLVREASVPLSIRVDPAQLKQVLLTLVQNAADSIGRSGTISLRARADSRALSNGQIEPVVVLEVQDTGKGIPPEVEKRLFDPFFTTKESGTGLGLSIAARVVEMNGGTLRYQTQVNHGSTFGIVLPRETC